MEYRPLEGFVFAVSPFNFTAIGGNLSGSPALMGNTVVWKPASTAALSAYYTMQLLEEAGLPDGRDQPRLRLGRRRSATRRSRAPSSPASTSPARRRSSRACGRRSATNIASYRNYPRIVGETGGKDFILAHPSADVDALATAIVRGSFEYQGQKCSAASRVYAPSNLWPELRERAGRARSPELEMGDVARLLELHGRRDRRQLVPDAEGGDRRGARGGTPRSSPAAAPTTARAASSSRP